MNDNTMSSVYATGKGLAPKGPVRSQDSSKDETGLTSESNHHVERERAAADPTHHVAQPGRGRFHELGHDLRHHGVGEEGEEEGGEAREDVLRARAIRGG